MGGALVYSNDAKTDFCDVPPLLLAGEGAVSPAVAEALAEGIRERCNTTLGVGITGVAGPTGGSEEADRRGRAQIHRRPPADSLVCHATGAGYASAEVEVSCFNSTRADVGMEVP